MVSTMVRSAFIHHLPHGVINLDTIHVLLKHAYHKKCTSKREGISGANPGGDGGIHAPQNLTPMPPTKF